MKKITFFTLLLMVHLSVIGQNLPANTQFKWADQQKFSKKMTLSEVAAQDESGYYILKKKLVNEVLHRRQPSILEKYDTNLKLVKSVDLSKWDLGKRSWLEKIGYWEGQLWIFYTAEYEKQGRSLYRLAVDPEKLRPLGERQFVMSTYKEPVFQMLKNNSVEIGKVVPILHIHPNEEQGKMLIVALNGPSIEHSEDVDLLVVDQQFNAVLKRKVKMPSSDKHLSIDNVLMDTNGNIHVLVNNRKSGNGLLSNHVSEFTIVTVPGDQGPILYKEIQVKNDLNQSSHRVASAQIQVDDQGNLYVGGFFSDTKSKRSSAGTFLRKMEGRYQRTLWEEFEPFEPTFLMTGVKASKAKRVSNKMDKGNQVEDAMYFIDQLIVKDDGTLTIVAESRITNWVFKESSGMKRKIIDYQYFNIVVASFDANGKRDWAKKILKRQHSVDDGGIFSSYSVSAIDDKLYFIFNDTRNNIANNNAGRIEVFSSKSIKKPAIAVVRVDAGGNTHKSMVATKDQKLLTIASVNTQVGSHEVIVYGIYKKKYRMGKLSIGPSTLASE